MHLDLALAVVLICLAFAAGRRCSGWPLPGFQGSGRILSEGFAGAPPGPTAPFLTYVPPADVGDSRYPGAISLDALDALAGLGHRNRTRADSYPEGNPANPGREAAPPGAPPCVDDEANSAEFDVDEGAARSALIRNDPIRPTAGTIRRKKFLDPYLREEVEEFEDLPWYGRHEL